MAFDKFWYDPWVLAIVGGLTVSVAAGIILYFLLRKKTGNTPDTMSAKDKGVLIGKVEAGSQVQIAREQASVIQIGTLNLNIYLDGFPEATGRKKELFEKCREHERKFEWTEAIKTYRKCLTLDLKSSERIALLTSIGNCFFIQDQLEQALGNYREAMDLAKESNNQEGFACALSNIATVYRAQGELKKALDCYQRVLNIDQETATRSREIACSLNNVGGIYRALGDKKKALNYYQRALDIIREIAPRSKETATCIGNIGCVYEDCSDFERALNYYHEALDMNQDIAARSSETARDLHNIGSVCHGQGNLKKALSYYQKAIEILTAAGAKREMAFVKEHMRVAKEEMATKS